MQCQDDIALCERSTSLLEDTAERLKPELSNQGARKQEGLDHCGSVPDAWMELGYPRTGQLLKLALKRVNLNRATVVSGRVPAELIERFSNARPGNPGNQGELPHLAPFGESRRTSHPLRLASIMQLSSPDVDLAARRFLAETRPRLHFTGAGADRLVGTPTEKLRRGCYAPRVPARSR